MKRWIINAIALLLFGCATAPKPVATAPPRPPNLVASAPQPLVIHPVQARTITISWVNHFTATNQVAIVEAAADLASHQWTRIYTGVTNTLTGQVDAQMQFYRAGNLALNQITN